MQGCSLADVGLLSEVLAYSEVDWRVMMEAVGVCEAARNQPAVRPRKLTQVAPSTFRARPIRLSHFSPRPPVDLPLEQPIALRDP